MDKYEWLKDNRWIKLRDNENIFYHDPVIHWALDKLPESHECAFESQDCKKCKEMIHALNNENMQPWVESGNGNYCVKCFSDVINDEDQIDDELFFLKKES